MPLRKRKKISRKCYVKGLISNHLRTRYIHTCRSRNSETTVGTTNAEKIFAVRELNIPRSDERTVEPDPSAAGNHVVDHTAAVRCRCNHVRNCTMGSRDHRVAPDMVTFFLPPVQSIIWCDIDLDNINAFIGTSWVLLIVYLEWPRTLLPIKDICSEDSLRRAGMASAALAILASVG